MFTPVSKVFFYSEHLPPALDASATLPRLDFSLTLFLSSLAPSFPLRPTFEVAPFSGNFAFEAASLPFLASAPDLPSSSMLYLLRRAFFWRASSSICKLCLLKAAPFLTRLITCFTLKKTWNPLNHITWSLRVCDDSTYVLFRPIRYRRYFKSFCLPFFTLMGFWRRGSSKLQLTSSSMSMIENSSFGDLAYLNTISCMSMMQNLISKLAEKRNEPSLQSFFKYPWIILCPFYTCHQTGAIELENLWK